MASVGAFNSQILQQGQNSWFMLISALTFFFSSSVSLLVSLIDFPSGVRYLTVIRCSGHTVSYCLQVESHLVGSIFISRISSGKLSFSTTERMFLSSIRTFIAPNGQMLLQTPQ